MVKTYTKWRRPKPDPEINHGKKITETQSYIPPKTQIMNMILAGERLEADRQGRYDFATEKDIDPSFRDPTRDPMFDIAQASELDRIASANLLKAEEEVKTKQAAAKKAEEEKIKADLAELEELRKQKKSTES